MEFGLEIQGDREARLYFETFPDVAYDHLLAAMKAIEPRITAAIRGAEPSRTGELRGATHGTVFENKNHDRITVVSGVRTKDGNLARKAAALEYGSHHFVTVRAHSASLSHIFARAIRPIRVQMPEHGRVTNIQPDNFLRGPLDSLRSEVIAELQAALDNATQATSA